MHINHPKWEGQWLDGARVLRDWWKIGSSIDGDFAAVFGLGYIEEVTGRVGADQTDSISRLQHVHHAARRAPGPPRFCDGHQCCPGYWHRIRIDPDLEGQHQECRRFGYGEPLLR